MRAGGVTNAAVASNLMETVGFFHIFTHQMLGILLLVLVCIEVYNVMFGVGRWKAVT